MPKTNILELPNGFVRVDAEIDKNLIKEIKIMGEINSNPPDLLFLIQRNLKGVELERKFVTNAINVFYLLGAKSETVTKEQLVDLIMSLKEEKAKKPKKKTSPA